MFKPAKMIKVDILGIRDDLSGITAMLAEAGVVHFSEIGTVPGMENILVNARDESLEKRYRNAGELIRKIEDICGEKISAGAAQRSIDFDLAEEIDRIEPLLEELEANAERIFSKIKSLEEDKRKYGEIKSLADSLKWLDKDIRFLDRSEFLHMRIGFVPRERLDMLIKGMEEKSLVFTLSEAGEKSMIVAVSPREEDKFVEKVLGSVLFQELVFPQDVTGKPSEIIEEVSSRLEDISAEESKYEKLAKTMKKESCDDLSAIEGRIEAAELHFFARSHFKATRDLVILSGWVPQRALPAFEKFAASRKGDLVILKDSRPAERINVPTKLENIALFRPFERLLSIYGLPDYKEVDPTFYVMIGFSLMFGMMFGDLGQGLVLAFIGWFIRKKKKKGMAADVGFLVMICGIFASIFGVLFGSVFGFENVMPALFFKPFDKINLVLILAILWGVFFIGAGVAINIFNKLSERNYVEALLGMKGLSGMLYYLGSVLFVAGLIANIPCLKSAAVLVGLVLLPLVFVALKDPVEHLVHKMKMKKEHHGETAPEKTGLEIFVMAVMEVYDSILTYLSNTLSFMRVAAFSLNHVGLLLAVFSIGEMLEKGTAHKSVGFWVTVVIGNIFVIILEGMIVTIQTLRLIYYESFSKFFSGDGIEYKPFSLRTESGK